MQIDHVLYGVHDLAEAAAWWKSMFGLVVVAGGAHGQWGTANAVLPVGNGQYVEIIAVTDPSSRHPLATALTSWISEGDRPVGAALRAENLDSVARRLHLHILDAERRNPDGSQVHWRMAGLEAALGAERLPFFIEWRGQSANPELQGVPSSASDGIGWVEFGGDADTLRTWLGHENTVPLVNVGGVPGVRRFSFRREGEEIVIGPR